MTGNKITFHQNAGSIILNILEFNQCGEKTRKNSKNTIVPHLMDSGTGSRGSDFHTLSKKCIVLDDRGSTKVTKLNTIQTDNPVGISICRTTNEHAATAKCPDASSESTIKIKVLWLDVGTLNNHTVSTTAQKTHTIGIKANTWCYSRAGRENPAVKNPQVVVLP